MSALQERSPQWVDWFPVQERIIGEINSIPHENDVLLIDVGGGEGHYIKRFRTRFPHAPGRLILQDLHKPKAVDEGIEYMQYSFFDPQPVKGKITNSPSPPSIQPLKSIKSPPTTPPKISFTH